MWNLVAAIVTQLPAMVELGVNVAHIIPELRKSVDAMAGNGEISVDDLNRLKERIDMAETAWSVQVDKAQKELDLGDKSQ